jgi:hypothetical protein
MLLCGSRDGTIRVWAFNVHSGSGMASGSGSGSGLRLATSTPLQAASPCGSAVSCCAWHYNSQQLLAGYAGGDLHLWRVQNKLEQGPRIVRHSQPPQSCAVWPGKTHDMTLSADSDGIHVVKTLVTVETDECGVRYITSVLPAVAPALPVRRYDTAKAPQQQHQQGQQQKQQQGTWTGSVEVCRAAVQPMVMSLHANGRLASLVTDGGSIIGVVLQASAQARARRRWQQAVQQVLQRKQLARGRLQQLTTTELPRLKLKEQLSSGKIRHNICGIDIPASISCSRGNLLAVATNWGTVFGELGCYQGITKVVWVSEAATGDEKAIHSHSFCSSAEHVAHCQMNQLHKVVLVELCVEAG